MVILLVVTGMIFLMGVFSYLYLYGIHPGFWIDPPALVWLAVILIACGAAIGLALVARHLLTRPKTTLWTPPTLILFAAGALVVGFVVDLWSWRGAGLMPDASGQGATVYALIGLQGILVAVSALMTLYLAARNSRGMVTRPRNNSADLTVLFIAYTGAHGALAAALVRLFPGAL
jgi:cytochrome c oxidase subunit I+III